jgi:hypothetical protein
MKVFNKILVPYDFSEYAEEALRYAINEYEAGRLTKEDAQKWLEEQDEDKAGQ